MRRGFLVTVSPMQGTSPSSDVPMPDAPDADGNPCTDVKKCHTTVAGSPLACSWLKNVPPCSFLASVAAQLLVFFSAHQPPKLHSAAHNLTNYPLVRIGVGCCLALNFCSASGGCLRMFDLRLLEAAASRRAGPCPGRHNTEWRRNSPPAASSSGRPHPRQLTLPSVPWPSLPSSPLPSHNTSAQHCH